MKIGRVLTETKEVVWVAQDTDETLVQLVDDPIATLSKGEMPVQTTNRIAPIAWLPPVAPTAILCIGLNYKKHAIEGNKPIPDYPVLFMKNPMAATGHNREIHIPAVCEDEVDYEAELAVVIGRTCRNVSVEDAVDYILGYMPANDVSARLWQMEKGGGQWNRGKSFDTFAPMGPFLTTRNDIPDPNALTIRCILNGQIMQESNTSDMIFSVPELIAFLSQDTTLLEGTVIFTGTPEGVGWFRKPKRLLKNGDQISIEIEMLGTLTNNVTGS